MTFSSPLRGLGAQRISAPRCAHCSKELRSFQRRGEDWYCGGCTPRLISCGRCGNFRQFAFRDRAGGPRCQSCPPDDGRLPVDVVLEVVAGVDPSLDVETVAAAVERVTSRSGQRRQLAWALEDRPELLTGAGAEAPVPSVLRLVDELCLAGAITIVRPSCPHCGRVVTLSKLRDGLRICRGCEARLRAVPCARCNARRDPASRDQDGRPLCANCYVRDPSNHEACVRCKRLRPVAVRTDAGPLCSRCQPRTEVTCSLCGRVGPGAITMASGDPWCNACRQRWVRCAGCGKVKRQRGGSATTPLCAACAPVDLSTWKSCPTCGEPGQLTAGRCPRCALSEKLAELLSNASGVVRPELMTLYEHMARVERPTSVLGWLRKSGAATILADMGSGKLPLTHDALDALAPAKPLEHLRAVLVSTGALPGRDEHMVRLERWVGETVASRSDPDEQYVLQRYGVWHLLRRLRARHRTAETTPDQAALVKSHVRAAIALLDRLAHEGVTLATCDQGHLDAWLASDDASRKGQVGHFVRWARAQKLTRLEQSTQHWGGPSGVIDAEKRWGQARRLLHDDTLDPTDRVAGLLVLLYAQRAAAISRLTVIHVEERDGAVRLHLGARPVVLPEPLAGLVLQLVTRRQGHAALGEQGTSPWLFPGGRPGRQISASRLTERLNDLEIQPGSARSAALFQLATEVPAAVLARMLGIHIKVAEQWQRASSGDWMSYAAERSRLGNGQRS